MAEPRAKRAKITRGEDDYLPGNITEMELHNFMTFSHLTCKPGSRLNLVIGPNGSGKSSLVCAIALALGGEPQLLGRATNVGAYVKRGEESGYIKISLRGVSENEQIAIMRKIDTRNKSEWFFNGKVVPKKDVIEVIQKFNIQVNNLTQFLPQDKVCEFAKLTPVQLLEETEKAVGDHQLAVQHRALVGKSHELKNLELAVQRVGETLNQLKGLNADLEKDVQRVRQREDLLAKVELMKKKLPWLKYDMKKAQYMQVKEKENDGKKKLDEAAKALCDFQEPIEKQKQEKADLDTKCKKVSSLMIVNAKKRIELLDEENRLDVVAQGKYNEMEDSKRQEESRQGEILKAKEEIAAAELELQNLPVYQNPKDELDILSSQISEFGVSANEKIVQKQEEERHLNQKKTMLRQCVDRLKDMESKSTKLLHALQNSGVERIFEAYYWLQQHRNQLSKEVYGPVLLEVNVSDRGHADYLEGHVPFYIWKSFITEDPRDRDILVQNLKQFDVPILNYVRTEHRQKRPFDVSEEMRALGISSRLDQVFDAPDAVKEVLISQFGLENSYIGSKETDQNADEVMKLGILDFWTPESHYRWSRSRYGNHVSASVDSVVRSRLLLCNMDVGEIEKLRSKKNELEEAVVSIEKSIKSILIEQRHLEDEASKLYKKREEIFEMAQREKKKRIDIKNRIDHKKRLVQSMENEGDLDAILVKLIDEAADCNIKRYNCAIAIKDSLVEAVSLKWRFSEEHMTSIEFDAKIRELEVNLKHHEKFARQASLHYENCKKDVEHCREQLAAAKRDAESIAIITKDLERTFREMPTTIEELEAAIQDNLSQANTILLLNQNVLQEYEHRQKMITDHATKLEADKRELKRCSVEIDSLKEKWLPALRNLVGQINETFSHNFQEMAVAGEVLLDEHGMDFDQFGILIKVKFRQTGQLQVLSAHHQSGGERSVSTILYLVSLQDLTNSPFRVVDEINQGMDPINERKMFQQLVRAASQPNTPQCFLLTPKLLPDLEYSAACSVLNIMNGPWIDQPSKAWSSGECWRTVMGLGERA
ncbi:structural maintenance of chromosomes protein 5 [Tripterygium wilfordii]|uniref:Structural maintenance of chromosomes protein 5 n=1 Tax=Tripterygium wilfordii TaxID=458696 RepID=A0A7J7CQS9_TRIWF|nr:structural maintenance of chromosomes protein 5 isoform X2 [Tripterygium wilfordii]KAF5736462.1 structural maintenance of chromosomes protein 5 [Tripterygium wilfordii]